MAIENPPAFPVSNHANVNGQEGMRLRDWFAGQALSGVIVGSFGAGMLSEAEASTLAAESYRLADAMLAERAKGGAA